MTILIPLLLGACYDQQTDDETRADRPATTTPSPTARAPTTAPPAATSPTQAGVVAKVRSVDDATDEVVLTVNGRDMTFSTQGLTLSPDIRAGATVTIDYSGSDLRSIRPGSQTAGDL